MGVKSARETLFSIGGLTMADIGDICKGIAAATGLPTPIIDVDCSNVAFRVGKTAHSLANFLVKYSKTGVKVVPVCDGQRPISKQATNIREAKREKNRIKAYQLRTEILSLRRKLKDVQLTDSERNDIREEVAKKEKSMEAKETHVIDEPKVTLHITDEEVKRRTAFPTLQHLLSYIFLVSNGDINVISERRTVLTWFEEWFMHFEFKWGRH